MHDIENYTSEELDALLEEIDQMEMSFTAEEEQLISEISKLDGQLEGHDLLKELGDAALNGVKDYVNSFIDVSDVMDDLKNPHSTRVKYNTQEVKRKNHSADPNVENPSRKLREANTSPYAADSLRDNSGMSKDGQKRLDYYEKAYKQRTKTIVDHDSNYKTSPETNYSTLAGLEAYQFGPKVPCYTADEYKQMYEAAGSPENTSRWIRDRNFEKFDAQMAKELGFSSPGEFAQWRKDNKLTIHESPDGMFLVPSDVHASELHSGEVSELHQYLRGKITKEELQNFEKEARIAKVKQETKVRGVRAAKGVGMATVKILVQDAASIIVSETYSCIKADDGLSFADKVKEIVRRCIERIKKELHSTWSKIKNSAACSVATEVFTALNDFVFKTAKNIFRMIRSMIGSILRAIKVICSSQYSWDEKLYEALKILSAGFVSAVGFGLNEVIKDFITTSLPPIAFAAPFIADVFSGLIACVMSSLVLMMFDRHKQNIILRKNQSEHSQLCLQLASVNAASVAINSEKNLLLIERTKRVAFESLQSMVTADSNIQILDDSVSSVNFDSSVTSADIDAHQNSASDNLNRAKSILDELEEEQ